MNPQRYPVSTQYGSPQVGPIQSAQPFRPNVAYNAYGSGSVPYTNGPMPPQQGGLSSAQLSVEQQMSTMSVSHPPAVNGRPNQGLPVLPQCNGPLPGFQTLQQKNGISTPAFSERPQTSHYGPPSSGGPPSYTGPSNSTQGVSNAMTPQMGMSGPPTVRPFTSPSAGMPSYANALPPAKMPPPRPLQHPMPHSNGPPYSNVPSGPPSTNAPPGSYNSTLSAPSYNNAPPGPYNNNMSPGSTYNNVPPGPSYSTAPPGPPGPYNNMPPGPSYNNVPPGPPYNNTAPGAPYAPSGNYQNYGPPQPKFSQPAAKKLDPNQMPSPIQVMLDDQAAHSGDYVTGTLGQVPPFATTSFVTRDNGCAGPRFIRSTMYCVPVNADVLKQTAIPFGLVVSPMARIGNNEREPPLVNMCESGPIRCIRCKAYMCPFMQFIDGGRRFHCPFCKATTEVPSEYFQHLDHVGQRVDKFERFELHLGSYELLATKEYCKNGQYPFPPVFLLMIDVSYSMINTGVVRLLCDRVMTVLLSLPKGVRVGIVTYGKQINFYQVSSNLSRPIQMAVGDVDEMFMPECDGFLCDPRESHLEVLFEELLSIVEGDVSNECMLGPAIKAGIEAFKINECSGKMVILHSDLPKAECKGQLKARDDRQLLGTDKEKTLLAPQTNYYSELGHECVEAGCSVDLVLFNIGYTDIATIGQVAKVSGGNIYKFTHFLESDGDRLINDLLNIFTKTTAFDAVMRIRTSTGIRPTEFYGALYMSNATDVELGSIDCDQAIGVEIKHDDKLQEDSIFIQVALLYTSLQGQRRLRIHNMSLATCTQMADLFRTSDADTLVNFLSKQAVSQVLEKTPVVLREALIKRCATALASYRKHCATASSIGQLILPECLKLLPLYVNCIMKSDCLAGATTCLTTDERSYAMQYTLSLNVPNSVAFFYPRLIPVHELKPGSDAIPGMLRCSLEKVTPEGAFLLENGIHMFMYLGSQLPSSWLQEVFGVPTTDQVNLGQGLPVLDNPLSVQLRSLVTNIFKDRHKNMRLTLLRHGEKMELVFRQFLVEDRGPDQLPSYVDFLCCMHKEIRNLL